MKRKKALYAFDIIVMTVITLIHVSPLIIVALNSIRQRDEIAASMIGFPLTPRWINFPEAWQIGQYGRAYATTLLISIVAAAIVMLVTGLAAYGVEKINCYWKKFFSGYFVIGLSIPYFAMMVPMFFLFHRLGLTNNPQGLIVLYAATNVPFCYMFVAAFLLGLPKELDEAARIDGCSEFQNFIHNTIPLAKPIMMSVILIAFVNCWNEYMFANLFLQTDAFKTISLRFFAFAGQYASDYGRMFAAAVISMLPIIVIYLLMQNTFIEGLTAGSVKG